MESELDGEVEKGQIRIEGHFCGVATTASHRLELAIPIFEEVDINLLFPLLGGFMARRESPAPSSPSTPSVDASLWEKLQRILEVDRKELDVSEEEDLLEELCPSWQKPNLGSRRSSFARTGSLDSDMDELQARLREEERELRATKAHERAMEVDFQAKEALVQNLMEERKLLTAKTQALTKQLETGVAERWLCSCLSGLGKLFRPSAGGEQLAVLAEGLEEREEQAIKSEVSRVTELEDGQVILEGHFTGQMVTKTHFMEVAMPVGATVPGVPVVQLLRAMCAGRGEDESAKNRTEVLSGVLALLEVDLPEAQLEEVLSENGEPEADASKIDEADASKIDEMSKEIEHLRSEQSRIEQEAEQLRIKNTTLATFLASAERSATQLRSALTEAGISADSPVSDPASPSHDMARNIKALESWAARLRSRTGGSPRRF